MNILSVIFNIRSSEAVKDLNTCLLIHDCAVIALQERITQLFTWNGNCISYIVLYSHFAGGSSNVNRPPYPPYPPTTASGTTYPPRQAAPYPPVSTTYPPVSQMPVQSSSSGTQHQSQPFSAQSSISEETIKASLMSAVDDKLRRRLKETFDYAQVI